MTTGSNFIFMSMTLKMPTSQMMPWTIPKFIWFAIIWNLSTSKNWKSKFPHFDHRFHLSTSSTHSTLYTLFCLPLPSDLESFLISTMHVALFQIHLPPYLVSVSISIHCHDTHLNIHIIYSYCFILSKPWIDCITHILHLSSHATKY